MKKYIPMIVISLIVAYCSLFLGVSLVTAGGESELYITDGGGKLRLKQLNISLNEKQTVRLVANVPEGKILKAYNITILYDSNIVAFSKAPSSQVTPLSPKYFNADTPGLITFNSFDIAGVKGNGVPLCDFIIAGKMPGYFKLTIAPNSFGASATDTFIPLTDIIDVKVK